MPQTVDPNTPLSPTSVGSLNLPQKNTAGAQTGAAGEGASLSPGVDANQNLWVRAANEAAAAAGTAGLSAYLVQLISAARVTNKLLALLVRQQTEIPDDLGLDAIFEDDVVN